jgi:hypothetical protein
MQRSVTEILPYLQTAIGPVILISGVGMLLLVMTNRFGRVVDRSRQIMADLRRGTGPVVPGAREQIRILFLRARVLRWAIGMASGSVLLSGLLVATLFGASAFHWAVAGAVELQFTGSVLALVVAVLFFLYDIHLSLVALRLELRETGVE